VELQEGDRVEVVVEEAGWQKGAIWRVDKRAANQYAVKYQSTTIRSFVAGEPMENVNAPDHE
jgi:hypothetical protein